MSIPKKHFNILLRERIGRIPPRLNTFWIAILLVVLLVVAYIFFYFPLDAQGPAHTLFQKIKG